MTHGHFVVAGQADITHHLYTSHDGHLSRLVQDLVELPFLLHVAAARRAKEVVEGPGSNNREHRFIGADPYYLAILATSSSDSKYAEIEEVYETFDSLCFMPLHCQTLAHWMVACHFSTWNVVVDSKRQMAYPGPDVCVELVKSPKYGYPTSYVLGAGRSNRKDFTECVEKALAKMRWRQDEAPVACQVRWDPKNKQCVVPFTDILVRLAWEYLKVMPKTPPVP